MSETKQTESQTKKRFLRKSGRTLVLKLKDSSFSKSDVEGLTGLQESTTTQNSAMFLTFDTKTNALEGLKTLKRTKKDAVNVKFAHYKVFFKLEGLTSDSKYDEVKTQHSTWVEEKTGGEVLYYKLYRKDDKYLGCGDMTVDTKDAIDKLLSEEHHKTFSFGDGMTGTFYRYKRTTKDEEAADGVAESA